MLIAPFRDVLRVGLAFLVAAEQHGEEVVRIAIVAGPAEKTHLVLAGLQALAVLAPFVGDELGIDADLRQIGLHHFRHALGIGIVGTLHRHPPQVGFEVLDAGGLQHLLGLLGIVLVVDRRLVIGPDGRRDRVLGLLAGALIDLLQDRIAVDRHGDRLAHFDLVEGRLLRVHAPDSRC